MTGLQLALASGTLLGLALALLVWRLAPSDPDLVDALDRLSPTTSRPAAPPASTTPAPTPDRPSTGSACGR